MAVSAQTNRSIIGAFEAIDGVAIAVHQERCAKVRNRNVTCLKCADACTSGCISLVDGQLVIDASKCVGCGTCATVCPTCALEARNPTDATLLAQCLEHRAGNEVVIVCAPLLEVAGADAGAGAAADELAAGAALEDVARVVCLGRVDESLVAALAAEGVQRVRCVCGSCAQCDQQHGLATAQLVAETVNGLLEAWGSEARMEVEQVATGDVHLGNAPIRAEEAACDAAAEAAGAAAAAGAGTAAHANPATTAAAGAAAAGAAAPLRVMKDGTLPHFLPDRRERLLNALADLGEAQVETLENRLWGSVVINGAKCVSCRMCATFCPTGALTKFDEADGTMGINHYPADCVKCGSCRDICPEDAIVLLDGVKASFVMDGQVHRYVMDPRAVELRNNPHQILQTMRQSFNGDIFER